MQASAEESRTGRHVLHSGHQQRMDDSGSIGIGNLYPRPRYVEISFPSSLFVRALNPIYILAGSYLAPPSHCPIRAFASFYQHHSSSTRGYNA